MMGSVQGRCQHGQFKRRLGSCSLTDETNCQWHGAKLCLGRQALRRKHTLRMKLPMNKFDRAIVTCNKSLPQNEKIQELILKLNEIDAGEWEERPFYLGTNLGKWAGRFHERQPGLHCSKETDLTNQGGSLIMYRHHKQANLSTGRLGQSHVYHVLYTAKSLQQLWKCAGRAALLTGQTRGRAPWSDPLGEGRENRERNMNNWRKGPHMIQ